MEIELLKISASHFNPRDQNYVQMPYPSSFFFSEKGKLGQLTGILLSSVPEEWEIYVAGLRTLNRKCQVFLEG